MSTVRLIARIDIKAPFLIKGINLEGLRKIGIPSDFVTKYYQDGIDEVVYMDVVASLYMRKSLGDIVRATAKDIFIPITVGGGIRSASDVEEMLRCGADKVAINTAAVSRPELLTEIANRFGSQCVVLSVEAKQTGERRWEAFTDNGREKTGRDVVEWSKEAVDRGAGEILLTSVDREGMCRGFDDTLTRVVSEAVPVPVIASGGMGKVEDLVSVVVEGKADAVAMASVLHYNRLQLPEIRAAAQAAGIEMRNP